MLNESGIKKVTYGSSDQILANVDLQASVGIVVASSLGVESDGKKIVKAGTPVTGSLDARTTPFTAATETAVAGILLHDVDVTNGNANGTLLIFGFVNTNRLTAEVKTLLTDAIKKLLDGKITFLAA
jgi:hypothetical protein